MKDAIKGLASASLTKSGQKPYLKWADTICRERVQRIESNQHRSAYDRAARTLGAMAECYRLPEK